MKNMNFKKTIFSTIIIQLFAFTPAFAAKPINLRYQPLPLLQPLKTLSAAKDQESSFVKIKTSKDFNQTIHVRIKQQYKGYPVWGGDAAIHGDKMNGTIYQDLNVDLQNTPPQVFQAAQTNKALANAISAFETKTTSKQIISQSKNQLMVYIDKKNKAHWVFYINLLAKTPNNIHSEPAYIMDANTFEIYEQWNNLKTLDDVQVGGEGGNSNGSWIYDYTGDDWVAKKFKSHLPALNIKRDADKGICYFQNEDITIRDINNQAILQFACPTVDEQHNNLYWDGDFGSINGGLSPGNDVLYNAALVKSMYGDLFNLLLLTDDQGNPMIMNFRILNSNSGNAGWSDFTLDIEIGDGGEHYYPLTSLDVIAHELSHGFTAQNAGLIYNGQSGALNESFSDMAAKMAEAYANDGQNDWVLGKSIAKDEKDISRYMDNPRHDCIGKTKLESCSIDNAKDYIDGFEVHFASGIFNKAFYLLSTSQDWNIYKAFQVMVQANLRYWMPNSTFSEAACGVMDATHDYGYNTKTVTKVMAQVGLDTKKC